MPSIPEVVPPGPPTVESAGPAFPRNLTVSSRGDDVRALQELLIEEDAYPEALVTGFFGPLTRHASIRFQEKYASEILRPIGLTAGTGYVGPMTRGKLNELAP